MALNPGDMAIIALFGIPNNAGPGSVGDHLIRIIATNDIPPGEVVRIYDTSASDADYIEYMVGSDGLSALDIVTLVDDDNIATVDGDPTGTARVINAATGMQASQFSPDAFATNAAQSVALVSDGQVIWGIDFAGASGFTANHSSTSDAEAHNAGGADPVVLHEDYFINGATLVQGNGPETFVFAGSTLEELDDPSKYVFGSGAFDYSNPGAFAGAFNNQSSITCFATGTRIATPIGARAVETLRPGDLVRTADNRDEPVLWVGKQTVNTLSRDNDDLGLVRITPGALGEGLPRRNLTLTADHALVLDGVLVNAGALVAGAGIRRLNRAETGLIYTVWHVETAAHEIILAEGAPTETFSDVAGRRNFDNAQEYLDLYGHARVIPAIPLPRISSARLGPLAVKARLGGGARKTLKDGRLIASAPPPRISSWTNPPVSANTNSAPSAPRRCSPVMAGDRDKFTFPSRPSHVI